ncbi:hypothetical protein M3579_00790 [Bacillus pumilus]|nr:hypothetical protein [Bacillus pumilus]MCM3034509.1 hypothetical protein [Bacillus pumilus]
MIDKIIDINKQLPEFTKFINSSMESIGKSISNSLIDKLKKASNALVTPGFEVSETKNVTNNYSVNMHIDKMVNDEKGPDNALESIRKGLKQMKEKV